MSVNVSQGLCNIKSYSPAVSIPITAKYIVSLNTNLAIGDSIIQSSFIQTKYVCNLTTKDNPGILPINLYSVGPPDVQPLDLTLKLRDRHSVQQMPQKEVTGFLCTIHSFIVFVKHDKGGPENTLVLACLRENV